MTYRDEPAAKALVRKLGDDWLEFQWDGGMRDGWAVIISHPDGQCYARLDCDRQEEDAPWWSLLEIVAGLRESCAKLFDEREHFCKMSEGYQRVLARRLTVALERAQDDEATP